VVSYKPKVREGERMLVRERMREREDKMKCLVFLCAAFRKPRHHKEHRHIAKSMKPTANPYATVMI